MPRNAQLPIIVPKHPHLVHRPRPKLRPVLRQHIRDPVPVRHAHERRAALRIRLVAAAGPLREGSGRARSAGEDALCDRDGNAVGDEHVDYVLEALDAGEALGAALLLDGEEDEVGQEGAGCGIVGLAGVDVGLFGGVGGDDDDDAGDGVDLVELQRWD